MKDGLILNIGCGGRSGDKMAHYGDIRVDIESFPNVTHIIDAHKLPEEWTGKFIEVVCFTALEHFENPYKALGEMVRVLDKKGSIIIVVPNVHYWRRIWRSYSPRFDVLRKPVNPPDHKQAWDLIEIRNLAIQFNLYLTDIEFLDWLPDKKYPPKIFLGKYLVKFLPKFMKKTEVKFTLRKDTSRLTVPLKLDNK